MHISETIYEQSAISVWSKDQNIFSGENCCKIEMEVDATVTFLVVV